MFPLLRSLPAQGRLALLPAVLALLAAALAVSTSALARQPSRPLAVDESPASRYAAWIRGTFREAAFFSSSLGRTLWYFVYLPPDYFESERAYPTLYLLHGGGGDKEEWPAYGLVDTLDELIMAGEVRPLILVLPHGDSSYWVNHVDGPRWGDYVALDLVEHVDATHRTLPSAEHRAVGGLSMGGHAALQLSLNYPGVFGVVGAHSASLRAEQELDETLEPVLGRGADFARRDPLTLVLSQPGVERLRLWLDVARFDPWRPRVELLHRMLEWRGVPHAWLVGEGYHDGDYWSQQLGLSLRFYDRALHAVGEPPAPGALAEDAEHW